MRTKERLPRKRYSPEFKMELVRLALEQDVTNGAIVIHTQRLKSDPGGNLLS